MGQPVKGIDLVLFFRILDDKGTNKGRKMLYQTEHSNSYSADSEETITKDGVITTQSTVANEISFKAIVAVGDDVVEWLKTAVNNRKILEVWEVDVTKETEPDSGKYKADYRQGIITEIEFSNGAENNVELDATFVTNAKAVTGEVTLSEAEKQVVQYAFRDLEIEADEDEE